MAHIKADTPQKQKWFDYLEELRQSGETNMWGAARYLASEFPGDFPPDCPYSSRVPQDNKKAGAVLLKWMKAHIDAGQDWGGGE